MILIQNSGVASSKRYALLQGMWGLLHVCFKTVFLNIFFNEYYIWQDIFDLMGQFPVVLVKTDGSYLWNIQEEIKVFSSLLISSVG